MASDHDPGQVASPPGFLSPDASTELPESSDPATDRVAGVELGGDFRLTYDWLDEQLAPTAEALSVATHGGGLRHAGLLAEPEHEELDDGLATMETFPGAYETPADLLSEYVARKYTLGRREFERIRELDERLATCEEALDRLPRQETAEAVRGVLIVLGEQLLTLGAFLYERYETFEPRAAPVRDLPSFPDPRRAGAVADVLAGYAEALPRAGANETLLATPPGGVDGVDAARETLAHAFAAVAYARWDAQAPDTWPLRVDVFPVTFAQPSPVTGMDSLTEYKTEGVVNDLRAFDDRLAESADRFHDGVYLDRFREIGERYREIAARVTDPDEESLRR
ncbi:hypothetical protein RYH80_17700 [Halobaculum sp. MBLA0147]|uniref:hypothetical protein n=1 Tax=Halobaculum sp. MBLA0147 TaxID=3079934 RepID=UPI003525ACC3